MQPLHCEQPVGRTSEAHVLPESYSSRAVMREVAVDAVEKVFPFLPAAEVDALATSIMRQWTTCDGHAVLMTSAERCYLTLREEQDSYRLTVARSPGDAFGRFF